MTDLKEIICDIKIQNPDKFILIKIDNQNLDHDFTKDIINKKIDAKICDDDFLEKVRSGIIKISNGNDLMCFVEIKEGIDNKIFNIKRVFGVRYKPSQYLSIGVS